MRGLMFLLAVMCRAVASGIGPEQAVAQHQRDIFVNGARVRLLLLHAQFGQQIENGVRFHFQFPRQLVDPDFLHRRDC
jgi:hypothetical protein